MHTFRTNPNAVPRERYAIGYLKQQNEPGGPWMRFIIVASCATPDLAVELVNFLNGGPNVPPLSKYTFI